MPAEVVPTPEEIARVTAWLQKQASTAQDALLAAKKSAADQAAAVASDLVSQNDVSGVSVKRKSWTDTAIPWQKRGDIETIRIDFTDGAQALVKVNETGDGLDLTLTNPGK